MIYNYKSGIGTPGEVFGECPVRKYPGYSDWRITGFASTGTLVLYLPGLSL